MVAGSGVTGTTFLTRVVLRNYRNIAACEVSPGPLTFLVGPNGAGKSNFLDALRFVADSLRQSVDDAFRERGGVEMVPGRGAGTAASFGLRIEFDLTGRTGHFAFEIQARGRGGYRIRREECVLSASDGGSRYYRTVDGAVRSTDIDRPPASVAGRFYLSRASDVSEFHPVYAALSGMGFYNFDPRAMRTLHRRDPGDLLTRDGRNLAGVLSRLADREPEIVERIERYLGAVVDGVEGVEIRRFGSEDRLEFLQRTDPAKQPVRFESISMSDGTLRLLGVLTGIFQGAGNPAGPRLIAFEEPEAALHPRAAAVLVNCLQDAAERAQVLVTTHSGDLFDRDDFPEAEVLPVAARNGVCHLGPMDEVGRTAVADGLYNIGELLRMDLLLPAETPSPAGRPELFDDPASP